MADTTTTVSDEANIEDVDLTQATDIGTTQGDDPGNAADDKPNDGAAATDEDPAKSDDKSDADAKSATEDPAKPAEGQAADEDPQKTEDANKQTPEEAKAERERAARQSWQERQRTRSQIADQIDQHYAPRTEEQLMEEEGLSETDAKIEAIREEAAYKERRAAIAELNAGMQAEAVNISNDFPIFNPNSPEYDPEFEKEVEIAYKTAARLQVDENGIITNAEVPLYDFYQRMAGIYSRGASKGAQQGQQDMAAMVGRTENPGGSSSTNGNSSDDLAAMEERLGDVVVT